MFKVKPHCRRNARNVPEWFLLSAKLLAIVSRFYKNAKVIINACGECELPPDDDDRRRV